MSSAEPKPFLILKDEMGQFHLTVRETRYNSQGYPWVVSRQVEETFKSTAAARAYAVEQFGGKAGEFAFR
ncbi:hypothetical protein GRI89_02765 [Altererythrobacter salegens]|uniref:Uncharacterized protein n=1 Tax=Croceibacterium salegens TaxID=1737568 RepID=A0A6I4SSE0_9SPHN|nr:hypothetical protein [Croceibacterium salegens]MXO58469.1 hypothetical protein [Croceibacterium salegens]